MAALYDYFHGVALEYGPGYRTLESAWVGGASVGVAKLRTRPAQRAVQVHPADLDDALCVGDLVGLSAGHGDGETHVPFAVGCSLLHGAVVGELWAVRVSLSISTSLRPLSGCPRSHTLLRS